MDHKVGQLEEWHAEPQSFGKEGVLIELIRQPGYPCAKLDVPHITQNNGTHLIGLERKYGLRINIGGWGWKEGASPMAVEKCAMLERVHGRWYAPASDK
jgi:hypothetical protein